jgi:hypothetical protein
MEEAVEAGATVLVGSREFGTEAEERERQL